MFNSINFLVVLLSYLKASYQQNEIPGQFSLKIYAIVNYGKMSLDFKIIRLL